MNKKAVGAWIIHHCLKLQNVTLVQDYEQISFSGKCGIILNALAGSDQSTLTHERLSALAKANGINVRLELPAILDELQRQRLIDKAATSISILGLTTEQTLEHTAQIFSDSSPNTCEMAAIALSEKASQLPILKKDAIALISDKYKIALHDTSEILLQCENIGFFDTSEVTGGFVYFNGNLFRSEDMKKVQAILSSLKTDDEKKVTELSMKLKASGCIPIEDAKNILGETLYSKLCAIGFFDVNSVGNEAGTFSFVTKPAAFSKFSNSAEDDAFDLAKAFVTSLTYGMTSSPANRGRIKVIEALMGKLIRGDWIGPATAIGQDYKILEMKGVVSVRSVNDGRYEMKLLKKDVGKLALSVITEGEASDSVHLLPSVSATSYRGPESNRTIIRRHQAEPLKKGVNNLLNDLRTGGIK